MKLSFSKALGRWCAVLLMSGAPLLYAQDEAVAPIEPAAESTEAAAPGDPFAPSQDREFSFDDEAQLWAVYESVSGSLDPQNNMVRVVEAARTNPVIGEVWHDHNQRLVSEMVSVAGKAFIPLLLALLVVQFIGYFAGAFLASKFFSSRHATVRNALIFTCIPTGIGLLFIGVCMTGDPAITALGSAMLSIALVIALIIGTMYVYDIGLLPMLLFGLVGTVVQSTVSAVIGGVVMWTMFGQMIGPVTDSLAIVFSERATPYVTAEVEELHPERDRLLEEVTVEKGKLDELTEKEAAIKEKVKTLQGEVASKRQTPQLVYTSIGQLVDQDELNQAIASYAEFAAKFSGHRLSATAKEQIEHLEKLKARNEADRAAARAAAIAAEKQRLAIFKQRLADKKVTLSNIRSAVLGKTRSEVIELLGQADEDQANTLIYTEIEVFDPVRNRNRNFIINFLEGRVQGVSYIR